MEGSNYLLNFSYVFIPFCIKDENLFSEFNSELKKCGKWEAIPDKISYLHRYVSDRLIHETNGYNLFRHRLLHSCFKDMGLCADEYCYGTEPKKFNDEDNVTFPFRILDVQLFSFNTSVCMLVYKLNFEKNDPFYIAAAKYYLRKINAEHIVRIGDNGEKISKNFIDFSKDILGDFVDRYSLDFFFYAQPDTERANFFTYVDFSKKEDYSEELFYLKWCYHDGFVYADECVEEDCVNYRPDVNKVWGISPSAAVCIVNRNEKNRDFIENVFQKNFQNQYLFTYVFLLHQKYMLYMFMTRISIDIDVDFSVLEDYKRRLYEFETKYVFSQISDVPQYQCFYEKVMGIFKIEQMFRDVQEPLSYLSEIQRLNNEALQQRREKSVNTALIAVSLLTIVSAFADIGGVTSSLNISENLSKSIQFWALIMVALCSAWAIGRLFWLEKENIWAAILNVLKPFKNVLCGIWNFIRRIFTNKKR